eukprot:544375-Rhodomonas_salina.2
MRATNRRHVPRACPRWYQASSSGTRCIPTARVPFRTPRQYRKVPIGTVPFRTRRQYRAVPIRTVGAAAVPDTAPP